MFIAKDEKGNLVEVDEAKKSKMYYCPCCGAELVLKQGDIKVHHFSHKSLTDCDDFYEPMTKWHLDWQRRFPKQCREVVVKNNGETHRADVLLRNLKLVIEFQHSPISDTDVRKRNKFYTEAGYKIIWVFDKGVGELKDVLNLVQYSEYGTKGKMRLIQDYTNMIVYDFDKFCYIASNFEETFNGKEIVLYPMDSMVCDADNVYDVLTHIHFNGGIEKLCKELEYNRKYIAYIRDILLRYINSQSRDYISVGKLFGMIGEYTVLNTDSGNYLNSYWKSTYYKDNRYTTRYLANAISDSDKTRMEHLRDSVKYDNKYYRVERITLNKVLMEIGERYIN